MNMLLTSVTTQLHSYRRLSGNETSILFNQNQPLMVAA